MKSKKTTILSLPEEIIYYEILPRLPVKLLLRFRCVSKSWRSLIRSKRFIEIHHQNKIQNLSFPQQRVLLHKIRDLPKQCSLQSLLSEEPIDPSPIEDPVIASMTSLHVVGCYKGLVCIRMYRGRFCLWNPSTRIVKKLPHIVSRGCHVKICGFGWDESRGEYKVFALVDESRGNVYSSKTKSWKRIECNLIGSHYGEDKEGVFVGGKLHWRNFRTNDIVFLDLKSEVFGRIEMPFDKGHKKLGEIGGCLCVLCYNRWKDNNIRVSVMKESWERLVDLSLNHELLQRPFSASFIQKGSNGEIFVFGGPTLLVYNPRDNVFRLPEVCRPYDSNHIYVESLLSPEDV